MDIRLEGIHNWKKFTERIVLLGRLTAEHIKLMSAHLMAGILLFGMVILSACSRSDTQIVVPGAYAFAHPDGWVEVIELSPNYKCLQKFYSSIDDCENGRQPVRVMSDATWRYKFTSSVEKQNIVFDDRWVMLDLGSLKSLGTPIRLAKSEAYFRREGNGVQAMVFHDENGYWASQIVPKPGGGYGGMGNLKHATDTVRKWISSL